MIANENILNLNIGQTACSSRYSELPTYDEVVRDTPQYSLNSNRREINDDELNNTELLLPTNLRVEISETGLFSQDERLNQDATLLRDFITTYNVKPELKLCIRGNRKESYSVTEFYFENNTIVERQSLKVREVVGFKKEFDLTSFISKKGKIYNPNEDNNSEQELEQTIKSYINSDAKLKRINIIKEVVWDYDLLTQKIIKALNANSCYSNIDVKYVLNKNQIKIQNKLKLTITLFILPWSRLSKPLLSQLFNSADTQIVNSFLNPLKDSSLFGFPPTSMDT
ncbi:hypothetical protein K502DRAFT_350727 [Neoconidiobolus thromboides FSU 785]|nr:hypothetical protein K502DRAFT_350727 [Neoconidiobolus thromboides FSU 785]